MESASSFSTSCDEVACKVQPNAALPNLTSPSNLVVMGRKLDRIHNYERQFAGRRQSGNSRRADRRGDQCTVCVAVATCAFICGNGLGSLRRSCKSPATARSRGWHPRLRPLKRTCWSDINHDGLTPNRSHAWACRQRVAYGQHLL